MVDDVNNYVLSPSELMRYTRHLSLPHFGHEGQLRIKRASALVVGLGGLGSVSSLYLTLAGIGTLGLIEDDQVSLNNLHRQTLYTTGDVGSSKLAKTAQKLKAHNPDVEFKLYPHRLDADNVQAIVREFDLVVDGTDNMKTRQIINQTCVAQEKPYVFGAVNLYDGQLSVFHAAQGPCLACLFPRPLQEEKEKQAEELAVLNTLPAVVGALQSAEVLKLIVGMGKPLIGKLLIYNALSAAVERINIEKHPNCPVCSS
jgi:molybdopterin/thiamine biosynthesis adenylyltransferase